MRLSHLFILTTAALLSLVALMVSRSLYDDWRIVRNSESGLRSMEIAHLVMLAAEKISAERRPMISVFNDTEPADPAKRARLAAAREETDAAFAAATLRLSSPTIVDVPRARASLDLALRQLQESRAEIDSFASRPLSERVQYDNVRRTEVISQLFVAFDILLDATTELTSASVRAYPELAQPLEGARLGTILREYAGRLGLQLAFPIAWQLPLSPREQEETRMLIGRVKQLRELLEVQVHTDTADSNLRKALEAMKSQYFAEGLPLLMQLATAGAEGRSYGMDEAQFTSLYLPHLNSIGVMRDAKYEIAREEALVRVSAAKRNLGLHSLFGMAFVLLEIGVFWIIRRRVLQPLLESTENLVAIAHGKLDIVLASSTRRDEIGALQNALISLRDTSATKRVLEHEREAMIDQLERASSTDFMTNLLNRRGFLERAESQLRFAVAGREPVSIIVFDIDHFKAVNDRFGHAAGDEVLRQIGGIIAASVRDNDHCGRYGGEEFISLLANCGPLQADRVASRLRDAVEAHPFVAGGHNLRVTVSIGVATSKAHEVESIDQLIDRADEALYQAKSQGRNRVVQYVPAGAVSASVTPLLAVRGRA